MEVSVHLRGGDNVTDMRSLALAEGLNFLNHSIIVRGRNETAPGADLVIQTSFGRSAALLSAIYQEIPYIVMEGPIFRDLYPLEGASCFTYNGMQNGGTRPDVPSEPRREPVLKDMKTEGDTLILAQKPTDHSLRGNDHIQWLIDKQAEYPDAKIRHHPLMVPKGSIEPIAVALSNCRRTISYNSTASVDSRIAGCETICEHWASEGLLKDGKESREEWLHRLSWYTFTHGELAQSKIAEWILSGYPQAEADAEAGRQEIPRERVDGASVCQRYYSIHTI